MWTSMIFAIVCTTLSHSSAFSAFNEVIKETKARDYEEKLGKVFTPAVALATAVCEVDERFLSIAIESDTVTRWQTFDVRKTALRTLCSALSPAYLRVGGTSADFLFFRMTNSFQDETLDFDHKDYKNYTMTAKSWDILNSFARQSGWELLFDLNVLIRKSDSTWDPTNATHLLEYSIQKNYTQHLHFELGNEPNAFKHAINRSLGATQLGKDFLTLRSLVKDNPRFAKHFAHSLLVGPDVTRPKKKSLEYLTGFLQVVQQNVDRVTFHQYYCNGRNTSLQEFLNPHTLALLSEEITLVQDELQKSNLSRLPLWLGETSSCYGGGAPILSESFVAGFLWADKLGLAARRGIEVVIRQSLYFGHYSLIAHDFSPRPDYWLSLLHKNLMGTKVLQVTGSTPRVRMYAHCTATRSSQIGPQYARGSVTLMILNLRNHTSTLKFTSEFADSKKHVYWLTPHGTKGLVSRFIDLNGKKLKMLDERTLPVFHCQEIQTESFHLPSLSYGFVVLLDAAASACLT